MPRVPAEQALARAALGAYLGLRGGEPVTIETWSQGLPWARALVVEARRRGAEPVLAVEDEEAFFRSLSVGRHVPRAPAELGRLGGAYVYLPGPEAFPRLFGLRPADLRPALDRHGGPWELAARASGLRAVRLSVAAVTGTAAARFGVNLDAWRSEVVTASLLPPPRLAAEAARLAPGMRHARSVVVTHPNGTRFEARIRSDRRTEETGGLGPAVSGRRALWASLPTGRLVLPVVPGSASGAWETNRPSYDRYGDEPVGIGGRFAFQDGRLTGVTFDRGGEGFAGTYRRAHRTPRAVTGLSIGLNPRVDRAPEVGDLARGTVGLRFDVPTPRRDRSGFPSVPLALLAGGDLHVDGRAWILGGRPVGGVPGATGRRSGRRRPAR
jgi:hypothetical protein